MQDTKQRKKFIETARELGCDEDPEAFERAVKKLAEAPPLPSKKRKPAEDDKPS